MRESLYESLKKNNLSYINEIRKINDLIGKYYSETYSYFETALKASSYNKFFINLQIALFGIANFNRKLSDDSYTHDFDYLIELYE